MQFSKIATQMVQVKKAVLKTRHGGGVWEEALLEIAIDNGSILFCHTVCFEGEFASEKQLMQSLKEERINDIRKKEFVGGYNAFLLHLLKGRKATESKLGQEWSALK